MMKTTLYLITFSFFFVACKTQKEITTSTPDKPGIVVNSDVPTSEEEHDEAEIANPPVEAGHDFSIVSDLLAQKPKDFSVAGLVSDQVTNAAIRDGRIIFTDDNAKEYVAPITNGSYKLQLPGGCYEVRFYAPEPMEDRQHMQVCVEQSKTDHFNDTSFEKKLDFNVKGVVASTGSFTDEPGTGAEEVEPSKVTAPTTAPVVTPEPVLVTDPDASLGAVAEADRNRISKGEFRYDSIPPLPINKDYDFILEIIPGTDETKFREITSANAVSGEIDISSEMSIEILSPNQAFDIVQVSDAVQVIDPEKSTIWEWTFIPRKAGKHRVKVIINIVTKGADTEKERKNRIEVFNQEVDVFVVEEPGLAANGNEADTLGVSDDAEKQGFNWLYAIIPSALLLLGGLLFFFRKKQQKAKEEQWIIAPNAAVLLEEVENKIAAGDTELAINKLLDFFKETEELHSELLGLSAQYQNYKRHLHQGTLQPTDTTLNRINVAIIDMVDKLQAHLRTHSAASAV